MEPIFNHIVDENLIVRFLSGETSSDENLSIEKWLKESEENANYFKEIQAVFNITEDVNTLKTIDTKKAWNKFRNRINNNADTSKIRHLNPNKHSAIYYIARIAAVIIVVCGIGYLLMPDKKITYSTIATKNNKTEDTLPDGTIVYLNINTTITYPEQFANNTREVTLSGEAFFQVSPDEKKPFIISANDAKIKVLGTSFDVEAYPGNDFVKVIVKTGKVLLYNGGTPDKACTSGITLLAGDKGIFSAKDSAIQKTSNDDINYLYWKEGILTFEQTPLKEVVDLLMKQYNVKIIIKDEELNEALLTAKFDNQPVESVMEILKMTFGINVVKEGNTYHILTK